MYPLSGSAAVKLQSCLLKQWSANCTSQPHAAREPQFANHWFKELVPLQQTDSKSIGSGVRHPHVPFLGLPLASWVTLGNLLTKPYSPPLKNGDKSMAWLFGLGGLNEAMPIHHKPQWLPHRSYSMNASPFISVAGSNNIKIS